MHTFQDLQQRQRLSSELVPHQMIGLYGQPKVPYVPPDPSPYPEDVLTALSQVQARNSKAVQALILGITSLFLGVLTGIPAIIYGHLAYREIKHSSQEQKNGLFLAIAGLVLGYCSLPLSVLYLLLLSGSIH